MTERFAALTAPNSYWQASRAPRYSLLFALPLLAFYQILALLLSTGPRSIRNGADVILQGHIGAVADGARSEEHTSELQSLAYLVCRLLLEKKKKNHHTS